MIRETAGHKNGECGGNIQNISHTLDSLAGFLGSAPGLPPGMRASIESRPAMDLFSLAASGVSVVETLDADADADESPKPFAASEVYAIESSSSLSKSDTAVSHDV